MNLKSIKSAREFAKSQGWEDGPKDAALDWLIASNERLLSALKELVQTADPRTNISDVPLLDALSLARSVMAQIENQKD